MSLADDRITGVSCENCGYPFADKDAWVDIKGRKQRPIPLEDYIEKMAIPRYCSRSCWSEVYQEAKENKG